MNTNSGDTHKTAYKKAETFLLELKQITTKYKDTIFKSIYLTKMKLVSVISILVVCMLVVDQTSALTCYISCPDVLRLSSSGNIESMYFPIFIERNVYAGAGQGYIKNINNTPSSSIMSLNQAVTFYNSIKQSTTTLNSIQFNSTNTYAILNMPTYGMPTSLTVPFNLPCDSTTKSPNWASIAVAYGLKSFVIDPRLGNLGTCSLTPTYTNNYSPSLTCGFWTSCA